MVLLQFIVVGVLAGWIMGVIRRGRGYGFIGNLVIGVLGSLIGWFLMGFLHLQTDNIVADILVAVAGAVVFFLLAGLLKGKSKQKRKKDDE